MDERIGAQPVRHRGCSPVQPRALTCMKEPPMSLHCLGMKRPSTLSTDLIIYTDKLIFNYCRTLVVLQLKRLILMFFYNSINRHFILFFQLQSKRIYLKVFLKQHFNDVYMPLTTLVCMNISRLIA